MKKIFLSLALLIGAFSVSQAFASSEPAGCKMHFAVHLESYILISQGSGDGIVICSGIAGHPDTRARVSIAIDGLGLGLGVFNLQGISGNLGILDPRQIEGTYAVAEGNVGVGVAVGAALGFDGQSNGLSFVGNVDAGNGVGVLLNGTTWNITLKN